MTHHKTDRRIVATEAWVRPGTRHTCNVILRSALLRASRRMAASTTPPSFEARRSRRAPQDDVKLCETREKKERALTRSPLFDRCEDYFATCPFAYFITWPRISPPGLAAVWTLT
jgi:hypothetical protein